MDNMAARPMSRVQREGFKTGDYFVNSGAMFEFGAPGAAGGGLGLISVIFFTGDSFSKRNNWIHRYSP